MRKRSWILLAFIALAIAGIVSLFVPAVTDDPKIASPAPELGSEVVISDARLVLPPRAGDPASIAFDVRNVGDNAVVIDAVAVEHARRAELVETVGPDSRTIANVPISPGETVSFGPAARRVVVSDYDSNVVPGATVLMTLTFGEGGSLSVPLTVQSSVGQGGVIR